MVCLGDIVIFRSHPENRDHRALQFMTQAVGQLQGSEGLVEGVKGPPEESGLLPGDHRHGPRLAQLFDSPTDG
jgi:hypothetical protein